MYRTIGFLGPEGTYSEIAAQRLSPQSEKIAFRSFPLLINALKKGEIDCAAVPVENTVNGAVTGNLDLLQEMKDVCAVASCTVKIDHRLVTLKGADKSRIKRIYSHAQALGQCARYLNSNFPDAVLMQSQSTSGCFFQIKSEEDAGIVGAQCKREGFELSDECISDEANNYTVFLLIVRGQPEIVGRTDRIFFSITCRHEVGALVKMLSILSGNGLNMTKIESRPIKNAVWEFRFFIEVEGDYNRSEVRAAIEKVKNASSSFKLLGCYAVGLPE